MTLLETLVALALIGAVGVALLSGIAVTSKAYMVADEKSTMESLARIQMEAAKNAAYVPGAASYTAASVPASADYTGYSANITAAAVEDGIQKITVTVTHNDRSVMTLEGYKVNR